KKEASLKATVQAMYGKLRRVPLSLSLGFFTEAAARLREAAATTVVNALPASLDSFWVLGFDGKKIKYVAKRLKPLRGLKGDIYGGKLLVVHAAGDDHYVVRFNTSCGFHVDSQVPARTGTDDEGRSYREEWGWLG